MEADITGSERLPTLFSQLPLHPADNLPSSKRGSLPCLQPHRLKGTEGDWTQVFQPDSPQEGCSHDLEPWSCLLSPVLLPHGCCHETLAGCLDLSCSFCKMGAWWVPSGVAMRVGADVLQGEGWEQGLAQGKSSRAVAVLIQDMREDFLLRQQGPGSSPHELHLLQIQREQWGLRGNRAAGLPSPEPAWVSWLPAPHSSLSGSWPMSPSTASSSRFLLTSQSHGAWRNLPFRRPLPACSSHPSSGQDMLSEPASHFLTNSAWMPPDTGDSSPLTEGAVHFSRSDA